MSVERSALQNVVYPRLKQYCTGKYGIDFQFVELHWGVEESTGYLTSDLDVMQTEIRHCRDRSIGPAFLCLVGHKLGTRFLPGEISLDHYRVLEGVMEQLTEGGAQLFEKFYKPGAAQEELLNFREAVDGGAQGASHQTPGVYILTRDHAQWINSEFATSHEDGRSDDVSVFKRTFRACVLEAAAQGLITDDVKKMYTPTAFETEMEAGLKEAGEMAKGKVMCILRTVRDLISHHDDHLYPRYCDVTDGILDEDSQARLLSIRELQIRQWVPGSNVKVVTSDWESVAVSIDHHSDEFKIAKFAQRMRHRVAMRAMKHRDYLEEICNKVHSQLQQLIDRAAAPMAMEKQTILDKVYVEVMQHWRRVGELDGVDTSEAPASTILRYLNGNTPFTCVVHGCDAAARSITFAKAAAQLQTHKSTSTPDPHPFTVVRCIPIFQPHEFNLKHLLWSLCRQVYLLYQHTWTETSNMEQLKKDFDQALKLFPTKSNPLYLLLDGMELLTIPHEDLEFQWIPENLGEYVKLVVSCSSSSQDILQGLLTKTPYEALIINLDSNADDDSNNGSVFQASACYEADIGLENYLNCIPAGVERISEDSPPTRLNESDQTSNAEDQFQAADDSVIDHSNETSALGMSQPPTDIELQEAVHHDSQLLTILTRKLLHAGVKVEVTCDGDRLMQLWLKQLQRNHGNHVVASVFRLLTLANRGLTECELLDLLSLDEELLNDGIFLGIKPLLKRFPELLWARLKNDLGPILQMTDIDNRDVFYWSIPGITQLTYSTFVTPITPAGKTHHQMALYFMGITTRLELMDEGQSTRKSSVGSLIEPEIRIDSQPSIFNSPDSTFSTVNYNMRKLSELPHHLLHSNQIQELKQHVIFNYKWLYNKLSATSVTEMISILSGLAGTAELNEDRDVERLITILQDSFSFIQQSSGCLRAEITGRLLTSLGKSLHMTSLIRQCDDDGYIHCPVTPLNATYDEGITDEVQQIIPCDTGYYDELYMTVVPGKNQVVTYTVPEKLCLWDTSKVQQVMHYDCTQYTYYTDLCVSQNGINLLAFNNGHPKQSFLEDSPILDIYDIDTGERKHRIVFRKSSHKPKRLFRIIGLNECKIMFDTPTYVAVCIDVVRLCNVKTGQEISKIPWPFIVTPDEQYLVMTEHDGQRLILRSFPSLGHAGKLASPKNITAIVALVTEVSISLLVAAGSAGTVSKYKLEELEAGVTLQPSKQGILVEQKDCSMKGGCGSLIISKDNALVLALYIYASGHDIYRTNFVVSTETLENIHIFVSGVKDQVQFSPDSKYLMHLKVRTGVFEIIDIATKHSITTYQARSPIRQICPVLNIDENTIFVITKEALQTINLDTLVEKGKEEQEDAESDSDSVSIEYNTPRIRLQTLNADVPLSALKNAKSLEGIPVKLTQIDVDDGEVKTNIINLVHGVHFADSELPSYPSEARVTPDGRKFLLAYEQLHIVVNTKRGGKKVLLGPLKDDFQHTKVTGGMSGMGVGRDVFGVGTNSLTQGTPLQKGEKIYGNNDTRHGIVFEAKGGEIIQRCPSAIRVYHADTGACLRAIHVRNEKLLTCSDNHVVTSSSEDGFANVYAISSGQLVSTLDCTPSSAVFSLDDNYLIIVSQRNLYTLYIYTGSAYLNLRKCNLSDSDLAIWEVIICPRTPTKILVSFLGEHHGQQDVGGINYAWVDVTGAVITNTFSCHSELVQMSPDGRIGVDSEFRFYNLKDGNVLFQVQTNDVTLTEHASFITDEGDLMVYLENEKGMINIIDIQKKKLVSKSFFHPQRSKMESLHGHHEVASLIPLHGGLEMVIITPHSVKHFLVQTEKQQAVALSMVKLRRKGYESSDARTNYYHKVNSDGGMSLTRRASNRLMHRTTGSRIIHGKRK